MMSDGSQEYSLVMPFWIDTDGYTDRDREMFVCGYEFLLVHEEITSGKGCQRPIHRENESRIRMMCGKMGVACEIAQHKNYEGCETWSELKVLPV